MNYEDDSDGEGLLNKYFNQTGPQAWPKVLYYTYEEFEFVVCVSGDWKIRWRKL